MSTKHYKNQLSAYLNHELPPDDERQIIAEHLLQCAECRKEHDQIKLGVTFASHLSQADAPGNLWKEIERSLDERKEPKISFYSNFRFLKSPVFVFAPSLLILLFGLWYSGIYKNFINPDSAEITGSKSQTLNPDNKTSAENRTGWTVETLAGNPLAGNQKISGEGSLAIGEVLETDANSRAKIEVADIGNVEIAPNSRVKLINTNSNEHRLSLERGVLQATILAPPRLFIVDTPSAAAVDLGCEYTLEVDKEGNNKLHVTSGYVSLERDGYESIVPAGAICLTKKGKGLGTPFFSDAQTDFKDAVLKFDFENGGSNSLQTILSRADPPDSLTLWHLLSRVPENEREKVFNKLVFFVKLPENATKKGVLNLDKNMLKAWRLAMEEQWFEGAE